MDFNDFGVNVFHNDVPALVCHLISVAFLTQALDLELLPNFFCKLNFLLFLLFGRELRLYF